MRKHVVLIAVLLGVHFTSIIAQVKQPVSFACAYVKANDSDNIKHTIKNLLSDKTLYYSISVSGLTDTGWVVL